MFRSRSTIQFYALIVSFLLFSAELFPQGKGKNIEVLDLNDVDLDEYEDKWQGVPKSEAREVSEDVSIERIVEPSSEYRYSSFGKSDPFLKPTMKMTIQESTSADSDTTSIAGKEVPMVSPLQAYPLDELEVKGVWVLEDQSTRAIVMTPKKEGIVIKVGDPIAAGKVLQLTRSKLVVRQYRLRDDGVREYEDISLPIGLQSDSDRGVIKFNPGQAPEFVRFGQEVETDAPMQQAQEAADVSQTAEAPSVEQPATSQQMDQQSQQNAIEQE